MGTHLLAIYLLVWFFGVVKQVRALISHLDLQNDFKCHLILIQI